MPASPELMTQTVFPCSASSKACSARARGNYGGSYIRFIARSDAGNNYFGVFHIHMFYWHTKIELIFDETEKTLC